MPKCPKKESYVKFASPMCTTHVWIWTQDPEKSCNNSSYITWPCKRPGYRYLLQTQRHTQGTALINGPSYASAAQMAHIWEIFQQLGKHRHIHLHTANPLRGVKRRLALVHRRMTSTAKNTIHRTGPFPERERRRENVGNTWLCLGMLGNCP